MQPSHDEIQREVENLRDIRRRSTAQGGPGALIIDPDLPSQPAQAAAAQAYWTPSANDDSSSSDSHSHENGDDLSPADDPDDPFHLFWVPARMHPEIDPAQFRAFLKDHARAPDATGSLSRSASSSSTMSSLGRKKSMLSRQYQPTEHDQPEEEPVVPLRRNRTSYYQTTGPQLTIRDLEKLDELAEEASNSSDPSKLRSVLRRSLSMNVAPSVIDKMDNMPDMGEDADAPIIVPRPGQILRRAARTKIRKPGQTGEGSHRFNATRRGAGATRPTSGQSSEPRTSSELSASDHGDAEPVSVPAPTPVPTRKRVLSNESLGESIPDEPPRLVRPESYSVEAFIFDAYARDDQSDEDNASIKSPIDAPAPQLPRPRRSSSPPPPVIVKESEPSLPIAPIPLRHPQPQAFQGAASPIDVPSRTPSPEARSSISHDASTTPTRPVLPERTNSQITVSPPSDQRKEKDKDKDKKGLFGKWGGEKKSKKEEKAEREKEKASTFSFGSLFGGSKKKQEENTQPGLGAPGHHAGREAAVALLGASKSATRSPSPQPVGTNNYSRYPIHVERAIYRLSHIKLANPRRPLYEQVLISNLMFWYLGVINKSQAGGGAAAGTQDGQSAAEKEQQERERKEKEERERVEKERMEREREREKRERLEQKSQPRKGSLTKTGAANRRAEMPVRGPQYDVQHQAMEQEYGYGGRAGSAPPSSGPGYYPSREQQQQQPAAPAPQVAQPKPQRPPIHYFGSSVPNTPMQNQNQAPVQTHSHRSTTSLPSGAMSPVDPAIAPPMVRAPSTPPAARATSPPSANQNSPRRSRSPPPPNRYAVVPEKGGVGKPGRSRSATATPPPPVPSLNGKGRKTASAHAVPPQGRRPRTSEGAAGGGGEEEDVPLALWQQQQRRR